MTRTITHAPLHTVGPTDHCQRLALRGGAIECPVCGKSVVRGALVEEAQEPIARDNPLCGYTGPCTQFVIYCDHCDTLFRRLFALLPGGQTGEPIGSYGLAADGHTRAGRKKIDAFLTQHPHAAGVE